MAVGNFRKAYFTHFHNIITANKTNFALPSGVNYFTNLRLR